MTTNHWKTKKVTIPKPIDTVKKEVTGLLTGMYGKATPKTVGKDIVFMPARDWMGNDSDLMDLTLTLRKVNNSTTVVILECKSTLTPERMVYPVLRRVYEGLEHQMSVLFTV